MNKIPDCEKQASGSSLYESADIEPFRRKAIENGATDARFVHPASVITAEWVRWKCRFGCPVYGMGWCCPPETPTPEETRRMLDSYRRAILFRLEVPQEPESEKRKSLGNIFRGKFRMLTDLEGELFKEGYYKAFLFISGPCRLCKECGKMKREPCQMQGLARPSMESCGIDVYQTARNSGFPIIPLHDKSETQNNYCLMMVD